ncbi:hypothetical protein BS78_02G160200 [Paspalum vaginatum]|nr:hypothetical protein BS78_02G160200 [Paspalum vaginatum]
MNVFRCICLAFASYVITVAMLLLFAMSSDITVPMFHTPTASASLLPLHPSSSWCEAAAAKPYGVAMEDAATACGRAAWRAKRRARRPQSTQRRRPVWRSSRQARCGRYSSPPSALAHGPHRSCCGLAGAAQGLEEQWRGSMGAQRVGACLGPVRRDGDSVQQEQTTWLCST